MYDCATVWLFRWGGPLGIKLGSKGNRAACFTVVIREPFPHNSPKNRFESNRAYQNSPAGSDTCLDPAFCWDEFWDEFFFRSALCSRRWMFWLASTMQRSFSSKCFPAYTNTHGLCFLVRVYRWAWVAANGAHCLYTIPPLSWPLFASFHLQPQTGSASELAPPE